MLTTRNYTELFVRQDALSNVLSAVVMFHSTECPEDSQLKSDIDHIAKENYTSYEEILKELES